MCVCGALDPNAMMEGRALLFILELYQQPEDVYTCWLLPHFFSYLNFARWLQNHAAIVSRHWSFGGVGTGTFLVTSQLQLLCILISVS